MAGEQLPVARSALKSREGPKRKAHRGAETAETEGRKQKGKILKENPAPNMGVFLVLAQDVVCWELFGPFLVALERYCF